MLASFPPSEAQCCVEVQPLQGETSSMVTGGAFWSWTGPHFERAATQSFWLPPTLTPYQQPCLGLKLHQRKKKINHVKKNEGNSNQALLHRSLREGPHSGDLCQWLTRDRASKAEAHPSGHLSTQNSWAKSKALGSAEWTELLMPPPMSHVTLETLFNIFVGSSIKWG